MDFFEYRGFIATDEKKLWATINWNTYSISAMHDCETILATTTIISANPLSNARLILLTEKPFYMDSGATIHISPCAADFVTLQSIPSWAIKGVGETLIQAIDIGQIYLQVQNQTEIYLKNVLYYQVLLTTGASTGEQVLTKQTWHYGQSWTYNEGNEQAPGVLERCGGLLGLAQSTGFLWEWGREVWMGSEGQ